MMGEHDFKRFPELVTSKLESEELSSPHPQIKEDFYAVVETVIDGDTIRVSCDFRDFIFPVRFLDIDAPELNEPGGKEVRDWLKMQIEGEEVEIQINKRDRVDKYGRLLGRIVSRGMDMGAAMRGLGMVLPFGRRKEDALPSIADAIPEVKFGA